MQIITTTGHKISTVYVVVDDLKQHVDVTTHVDNHTLDLIMYIIRWITMTPYDTIPAMDFGPFGGSLLIHGKK